MADHYCYIEQWEVWKNENALDDASRRMRENGAVDFRATAVDEDNNPVGAGEMAAGYWVEGWNEKQRPQYPAFNPPVQYADAG